MEFTFSETILASPEDVFAFFRDLDRHAGKPGTLVPVYDKITPGPVRVGTRFREVVQVLPFWQAEIISEIARLEPERCLEYRFSGLGMDGALTYTFASTGSVTSVQQKQNLRPRGLLKLFSPLIGALFQRMAGRRLPEIKAILEGQTA